MSDVPEDGFTGHCILHAAVHPMTTECWHATLDWNFAHPDGTSDERAAAYKAEVRRLMAERSEPGSCVYPVGCVYPGEGCTGPCADRNDPDMELMASIYAATEGDLTDES